jgi:alpha-1,3-mannosyltransferase
MQFDVIHLVRIFRPNIGGMETIVENIVLKQIEQKLNVCVITTNYTRDKISDDYVEDFKVIRLNHFNIKNNLLPKEIPKYISTNILHVHGMDFFVDFISLFIRYNKKIISPHGGFFHTNNLLLFKKVYFALISKLLYRNSNAYCISYNDVDLTKKFSKSSTYMGCGFISRETMSNGGNQIIIFGRIGKNKRVDNSIQFAINLFNDSEINIIGHDEIDLMKNYINEKKVNYHGVVGDNQFDSIVQKSGFFIFLSEYEGLGMSLIEALDMGLRCIVSNIESFRIIYNQLNPEIINKFLFFVDYNNQVDPSLFFSWIKINVTKDDRLHLRNNVREIYNWNIVVKKLNNEL